MMSIVYYIPGCGFGAFRCCALPNVPFAKEEIPLILSKELGRITGINVPTDEMYISWNIRVNKPCDNYTGPREYFLDDGLLGWDYAPSTRIPGKRWRLPQVSHEVSAAIQRIKLYKEGYITIEERLTRWGLVMYISTKIQEFQNTYSNRPEEWKHTLHVLDICEEDIKITTNFANGMHLLNPIHDLIPIRVLEVVTVFRVMFRLSLQKFEFACNASM
jgi:hypothetical protein